MPPKIPSRRELARRIYTSPTRRLAPISSRPATTGLPASWPSSLSRPSREVPSSSTSPAGDGLRQPLLSALHPRADQVFRVARRRSPRSARASPLSQSPRRPTRRSSTPFSRRCPEGSEALPVARPPWPAKRDLSSEGSVARRPPSAIPMLGTIAEDINSLFPLGWPGFFARVESPPQEVPCRVRSSRSGGAAIDPR